MGQVCKKFLLEEVPEVFVD